MPITVALREQDGELTFQVTDDGPGFDPSHANTGAGLQNMRDRIGALDGRLSIIAAPRPGHDDRGVGALALRPSRHQEW